MERGASLLAGIRRRWLVAGATGFIGSRLLETLLANGPDVIALVNFAISHRRNLESVGAAVGGEAWRRRRFIEVDIVEPAASAEGERGTEPGLMQHVI